MYQRILVPLDGSRLAEQVLPYVGAFSKALGSPVLLLRIFNPVRPELNNLPIHGQYLDRLDPSYRDQALESLNEYMVSIEELGVVVSRTVHEGDPATHIINEAGKESDTLIAMSTHGRSGITRLMMGSVTDKVLQATTSPLLIIRARPQESFSQDALPTRTETWAAGVNINTITVPLDGSPLSEQILPHAVSLAKSLEIKVSLVRVTPSLGADPEVTEYLHQVSERLRQEGVPLVEEQVLHGDAAGAIVDMTQQVSDNLVVITTHGRSGIGRWVLGSTADRVVRYSRGPVLVIRARN